MDIPEELILTEEQRKELGEIVELYDILINDLKVTEDKVRRRVIEGNILHIFHTTGVVIKEEMYDLYYGRNNIEKSE